MAEISNDELIRMLRRYAKWIKDKSNNSFQKNENLWKLILLAAERLYHYERMRGEDDENWTETVSVLRMFDEDWKRQVPKRWHKD